MTIAVFACGLLSAPGFHFAFSAGLSILIFLTLWFVLYRGLEADDSYQMEPKGRSFEPLLAHYFDVAKVVISLAVGSIALLAGYIGFVLQGRPDLLSTVQRAIAWPLPLLAFGVIYAVLFLASLAWSYERYLHFPESYTGFWYSLNQALGFSGLTCFALGYLALAISVVLIL